MTCRVATGRECVAKSRGWGRDEPQLSLEGRVVLRFRVVLALCAALACNDNPVPAARDSVTARQQATAVPSAEADSARAFVQRFYDWYMAVRGRDGDPYDSLLAARRSWLGGSLATALAADVQAQRADTVSEIASLSAEADIFLNSQDPCERYQAKSALAAPGGTYAVRVRGDCPPSSGQPEIDVYVRRGHAGWQIANIMDPSGEFDLVGDLVRYHAGDSSPGRPVPVPR